jgi:hypothetical protein
MLEFELIWPATKFMDGKNEVAHERAGLFTRLRVAMSDLDDNFPNGVDSAVSASSQLSPSSVSLLRLPSPGHTRPGSKPSKTQEIGLQTLKCKLSPKIVAMALGGDTWQLQPTVNTAKEQPGWNEFSYQIETSLVVRLIRANHPVVRLTG